jgi:formate hydrogenlyase subunit 3/multisubunit Na+/H+ antiporter MnhD subunit
VLLILGFGLKIGLAPGHVWMPLAYTAAPIPAAAALSGAAVKAGMIGLIRFMPLGFAMPGWGEALAAAGMFSAFYGVAVGITQRNPKTVLAYSSVSQMGLLAAALGMGLAASDIGAAPGVSFAAAHHVLAKGALFLAIGVSATAGPRLWPVLIPAAVLAVGLGGLPLTGGMLAKLSVKPQFGGGVFAIFATLSAVASTLLMLHFLHRLVQTTARDRAPAAPAALTGPWLVLAFAAVAVPWIVYPTIESGSLLAAVAPATLWTALWPVLIGGVLAVGLWRWVDHLPRLPMGDVVVIGEMAVRASISWGKALERADGFLRQWPVASLSLLTVAIVLGVAMLAWG